MTWSRALLLFVVLFGAPASAQDARLVLRDAVLQRGPDPVRFDTTGWQPAVVDEQAYVLGDVRMSLGAGSVTVADLDWDPYTNAPMVSLELSPAAAAAFSELTESRRGRAIAIVLDGRVLVAPTINERIPNGRIQISGAFTRKEALAIVRAIRVATKNGARG